jgi:hypothetical protein
MILYFKILPNAILNNTKYRPHRSVILRRTDLKIKQINKMSV